MSNFNTTHPQRDWLMLLNCTVYPLHKTPIIMRTVKSRRVDLPSFINGRGEFPINHRVIAENEIVFEFDNEEYKRNVELTEVICELLKEQNIPYILGFSGNKSYHIHIFINYKNIVLEEDIADYFRTKKITLADVKNQLVILKFGDILKKISSEVGEMCLDEKVFYKNHPIREFGGTHEKTNKPKTFVDHLRWKPTTLVYPPAPTLWECKEELEEAISKAIIQFHYVPQKKLSDYGFGVYSK